MSNAQFIANVDAWIDATQEELLEKTQLIILETFTRVIYRTPVLTGRLRGSWQLGVNSEPAGGKKPDDPQGSVTVTFTATAVEQMQLGDMMYFYNHQPYAAKMEYGGSKKAPRGMVRVTLREIQAIVNEVVGA